MAAQNYIFDPIGLICVPACIYLPVKISLVLAWQVKTGAEAPFSCRQEPSQAHACSPGRCRERSFPFLITLHRWLPRAVGAEGLARKIRLSMLDLA
jgi:hypothetical protein